MMLGFTVLFCVIIMCEGFLKLKSHHFRVKKWSIGETSSNSPSTQSEELRLLLKDSMTVLREQGLISGLQRTQQGVVAISQVLMEASSTGIATRRDFPKVLRVLFEKLGSTYIKLGQFIASSPTLFPREYVEEFQKCLDQAES